jgi:hypothetical protein
LAEFGRPEAEDVASAEKDRAARYPRARPGVSERSECSGRLPTAGLSDDSEDLAGLYRERNAIDDVSSDRRLDAQRVYDDRFAVLRHPDCLSTGLHSEQSRPP